MSKNSSFSFGEHFNDFVETQIGRGRYNDGLRCAPRRQIDASRRDGPKIRGKRANPSHNIIAFGKILEEVSEVGISV